MNDKPLNNPPNKPPTKTGISRIWAAFLYSLQGLRFAISSETAFQQEAFVIVIATVVLLFLPLSLPWKGLLFLAIAMVLVVELLNSAIETIVDLESPEYHLLAKRAKDVGSAAVLVSIVIATILWGSAIITIVFPS